MYSRTHTHTHTYKFARIFFCAYVRARVRASVRACVLATTQPDDDERGHIFSSAASAAKKYVFLYLGNIIYRMRVCVCVWPRMCDTPAGERGSSSSAMRRRGCRGSAGANDERIID